VTKFYTRRREVRPLKPGERIDFRKGKGYFVVPAPTAPKSAPVQPPASPFAGVGLFTAWDPRAALQFKGPADWVAVQGDPESGSSTEVVTDLLHADFNVYLWEARAKNPQWQPYIGQAESQPELEACLALSPRLVGPKAIVGNPSAWTADGLNRVRAQAWELLIEWYQTDQPGLTFAKLDSRGYPITSYVIGVYHDYPLATALAQVPKGTPVSIYLAETCKPDDIDALRAWLA